MTQHYLLCKIYENNHIILSGASTFKKILNVNIRLKVIFVQN